MQRAAGGAGRPLVERTEIRVRYAETDQMGVVYHAHFLVWFEVGRVEFLRSRGIAYRDLERRGILLAVRQAECDYLRPARYDDRLILETTLAEVRRTRVRFEYRVLRDGEAEPLATGGVWIVCVGPGFRPMEIPGELHAAFAGEGGP